VNVRGVEACCPPVSPSKCLCSLRGLTDASSVSGIDLVEPGGESVGLISISMVEMNDSLCKYALLQCIAGLTSNAMLPHCCVIVGLYRDGQVTSI
jgi:hypothetical protein